MDHPSVTSGVVEFVVPPSPKLVVNITTDGGVAVAHVTPVKYTPVPAAANAVLKPAAAPTKGLKPAAVAPSGSLRANIPQAVGPTAADDCSSATSISGDGTYPFDNSAATEDGSDHAACDFFGQQGIDNDVWYCWTADCDATVTVETCGLTGVDTKIAVYDGCGVCPPTDAELLACNDDTCSLQSQVVFSAIGGNDYLIRIGTFPGAAGGTGSVSIASSPMCGGGGGSGGADDCASADAIAGQGTFAFDNSAATEDGPDHAACDFFGQQGIDNDVWFCWTADCDSDVTIETCGLTGVDTKLAVYDGCSCPPTDGDLLACNDDTCSLQSQVMFTAVSGNTYLIRLGTFPGAAGGTGQFSISCAGGGGGSGGSDDCSSADPISGVGNFAFDNSAATSDGLDHAACDFFGQQGIDNDVWFCWTAPCDGSAIVQTCGLTGVDTKIAAYDGCGVCPPTDAELLACNDDTCSLQSLVSFPVVSGNDYLIRVGTFPGAAGGTGSIAISCSTAEQICMQSAGNCQAFATDNASQSNDTAFRSADDFTPAVSGDITDICWWGAYLPSAAADSFTVTYYADNAGIPGAIVGGPFTGGGLTVMGPADTGQLVAGQAPIWEYTATHAAVSVTAGQCYWIEIKNNPGGGATWFWEWSFDGNGRVVVDAGPDGYTSGDIALGNDFAFCINLGLGAPGDCLPPPAANDDCVNAEPLVGTGTFPFDNSAATTDGPAHAACDFFADGGQTDNDVWFCWTATCDGLATVETCGLTGVDTKIVVYDGCSCPPTDAELITCNDDFCGLQSHVSWSATSGNQYLIRIGTFPGEIGGIGSFSLSCTVIEQICFQSAGNCQAFATDNASQSNDTAFRSADDFTPAVSGDITDICWWGAYLPSLAADSFTVTYYDDAGGIPGSVIGGPFTGGGLTVMGPADTGQLVAGQAPIYEYTATHAGVSVTAGQCYWIEIKNNPGGGATWFWEWSFAGNGRVVVDVGPNGYDASDIALGNDFAFCINLGLGDPANCLPPPAENDDCANAEAIAGEGTFGFDNTTATTDGPAHTLCDFFGEQGIDNDLWWCWTAPCTSDVRFETCGLTGVDTKIAVYDGCTCPPTDADIIACNDDDCSLQSGLTFSAVAGQTYLLRVGTFPGAAGGIGAFSLTCVALPSNDLCENAIGPLAVPSNTPGTTVFATTDTGVPTCGTSVTSPGVWYTVVGTGNTMTASLCNGATAFDSKLGVFCGDCGDLAGLTCVAGIDDFCGLQSEVSWCSQAGATYLILVHGFGGATGTFELTLSDDGVPCEGAVFCLNTGACCIGQDCQILTPEDCANAGGSYLGDFTDCGGVSTYEVNSCGNALEDISATGTNLGLGDDAGAVVALGFTFNFFGVDHTDVGVSSNGYLTFGASLTDLSNDPIPSTATPNDLIAPLWDDLNPSVGGSVTVQTLGTAPNRRFIAQWTDVPQFSNTDMNTFQAVLFEGTNCIELRYGNFTTKAFAGDYTVGIENPDGTAGVAVDAASLMPGDCVELCPVVPPNPCEVACTPTECAPGSIPLVDAQGDFAGWCVTTNAPGDVDIFVDDVNLAAGYALIEISKDFNYPPGFGGLFTPILLDFTQACDDENTVTMIYILDESITNNTGVDWTDFHWNLFEGDEVWFDVAASSGFNVAPFTGTFGGFIDSPTNNKAKSLDCEGGVVPFPSSFFPGNGTGELKIGIDLSGENPVSFTLKERPTTAGAPAEFGACCFSNGTCADLSSTDCAAQGGTFQGDGSACSDCQICGMPSLTNDDCPNAIAVEVPSTTHGSTIGANVDGVPTCGTSNTAPGVWYSVMGTGNTMTASTCNECSDYDTKISVFCAGCDTLVCVDGNDDNCDGFSTLLSTVSWCSSAGTEYLVLVHGFSSNAGNFRLDISDDGTPCTGATDCTPPAPLPDNCEDAQPLGTLPASVTFDNTTATEDHVSPTCGVATGPFKNVWYSVVGNGNEYTATTCNAGTVVSDTKISVWCGDCAELVCVDGNDDDCVGFGTFRSTVTWCTEAGSTYLISVGNFSASTTPGVIQLDVSDSGSSCSGAVPCMPVMGDNDDCGNAEEIGGEGMFPFDNSGATTDGPDHAACNFFGQQGIDNDVWFCWTASCDGDVRVETCGQTGVDTKMAVYDGCSCPVSDAGLLACNDDDCSLQSGLSFTAVSGNTYLIRLGTFPGAAGGSGTFSITCTGPVTPTTPPFIDIRPSATPNLLNPAANGALPVGLMGSADFDVTQIDLSTVSVHRQDGEGGSVAALNGPIGPGMSYADLGAPDGFTDLLAHFRMSSLVSTLKLNALDAGDTIALVVTGQLLNGQQFKAVDTITMIAPGKEPAVISVSSNIGDTWIESDRADAAQDMGGYAQFDRGYDVVTSVYLTAPATSNGKPFLHWIVNGEAKTDGELTVKVVSNVGVQSATAVYRTTKSRITPSVSGQVNP